MGLLLCSNLKLQQSSIIIIDVVITIIIFYDATSTLIYVTTQRPQSSYTEFHNLNSEVMKMTADYLVFWGLTAYLHDTGDYSERRCGKSLGQCASSSSAGSHGTS